MRRIEHTAFFDMLYCTQTRAHAVKSLLLFARRYRGGCRYGVVCFGIRGDRTRGWRRAHVPVL